MKIDPADPVKIVLACFWHGQTPQGLRFMSKAARFQVRHEGVNLKLLAAQQLFVSVMWGRLLSARSGHLSQNRLSRGGRLPVDHRSLQSGGDPQMRTGP
jgi:hypothetical protein